jgi:hypothetical protein
VDNIQNDYKQVNGKPLENKFICAVPYLVKGDRYQIIDQFGASIITANIVKPLMHQIDIKFDDLDKHLGCVTECVTSMYFDHKIANDFGSFPQVFPHIIKAQPSRYRIEELKKNLDMH